MKSLIALASLALVASACGTPETVDPVVGVWQGETAGCLDAANDGKDVVISVLENHTAAAVSVLGASADEGEAITCSGGGATLAEDDARLRFTSAITCGDTAIELHLSLRPGADADTQTGPIAIIVDGAPFDLCELTVTR